MTIIAGLSNKNYFELLSRGGELKVIISKADYQAFANGDFEQATTPAPPKKHLGQPWEIVVFTISSLGGEIEYKEISPDQYEATIRLQI